MYVLCILHQSAVLKLLWMSRSGRVVIACLRLVTEIDTQQLIGQLDAFLAVSWSRTGGLVMASLADFMNFCKTLNPWRHIVLTLTYHLLHCSEDVLTKVKKNCSDSLYRHMYVHMFIVKSDQLCDKWHTGWWHTSTEWRFALFLYSALLLNFWQLLFPEK